MINCIRMECREISTVTGSTVATFTEGLPDCQTYTRTATDTIMTVGTGSMIRGIHGINQRRRITVAVTTGCRTYLYQGCMVLI